MKFLRHEYRGWLLVFLASLTIGATGLSAMERENPPNVVFVFADQWRQQATGYAGDPNVKTPRIDTLASQSLNFFNAVSSYPVCSPYRASLMTGQNPLTHGVFVNDVPLRVPGRPHGTSIAEAFKQAGYSTAYIGKWHIDGQGRSSYIPPKRRLGFDYWKGLECTHAYNSSRYFTGDSDEPKQWEGYDAIAQTRDAVAYIREHAHTKPFLLMLSWGPPHAPYGTAPENYLQMYDPETLELRPNVPPSKAAEAREWLAGYYAHCSALDDCMGMLLDCLEESGIGKDTILVFTSDHGDMLGSQGNSKKQQPWEESIRVPFLLRYPALEGFRPGLRDAPIEPADIMPTLLGLCGQEIPESVEGVDYSGYMSGGADPKDGSVLILCPHPFAQWSARSHGGREYRGLRTPRYTYVRDLKGPWLLYDNQEDPFQLHNRIDDPELAETQADLDRELHEKLRAAGDEFLPGQAYLDKWGYKVGENGAVPYSH